MMSASWDDLQRKRFLVLYRDALNISTADNGLKKQEWTAVMNSFNNSMNCQYNKAQLQSQLQLMKKKYVVFKGIIDNSGFGWDKAAKMPTAPPDVWDRYIAKHSAAKEFRTNPLPFFEELDEIFTGRAATGAFAVSSASSFQSLIQGTVLDNNITPSGRNVDDDDDDDDDEDDGNNNDEEDYNRGLSSLNTSDASSVNGRNNGRSSAGSTASASSRQRKRKSNEIADALNNLADTNRKTEGMSTVSEKAIFLFIDKHKEDFSTAERVKIKTYFAEKTTQAHVFLTCDEEEQNIFLNNIIA